MRPLVLAALVGSMLMVPATSLACRFREAAGRFDAAAAGKRLRPLEVSKVRQVRCAGLTVHIFADFESCPGCGYRVTADQPWTVPPNRRWIGAPTTAGQPVTLYQIDGSGTVYQYGPLQPEAKIHDTIEETFAKRDAGSTDRGAPWPGWAWPAITVAALASAAAVFVWLRRR
jgi:hypothetical protein